MRRTTAASGLDGWGTQHNSSLINAEYRDREAAHTHLSCVPCVLQSQIEQLKEEQIESRMGAFKERGVSDGSFTSLLTETRNPARHNSKAEWLNSTYG